MHSVIGREANQVVRPSSGLTLPVRALAFAVVQLGVTAVNLGLERVESSSRREYSLHCCVYLSAVVLLIDSFATLLMVRGRPAQDRNKLR